MTHRMDRRDFVKAVAATAGVAAAAHLLSPMVHAKTSCGNDGMIYRTLGRTGERVSVIRMGKALQDGYRQKVFLMDKIDGHTKAEAARQIDTCLQRLHTDRIDLMQ